LPVENKAYPDFSSWDFHNGGQAGYKGGALTRKPELEAHYRKVTELIEVNSTCWESGERTTFRRCYYANRHSNPLEVLLAWLTGSLLARFVT